jgi:hypothetical protein
MQWSTYSELGRGRERRVWFRVRGIQSVMVRVGAGIRDRIRIRIRIRIRVREASKCLSKMPLSPLSRCRKEGFRIRFG